MKGKIYPISVVPIFSGPWIGIKVAKIERDPPIIIIEKGTSNPIPLMTENAVRYIRREIIGVEIAKKIMSFLFLFDKLDNTEKKKFMILFPLEIGFLWDSLLRE